jgi:azurin
MVPDQHGRTPLTVLAAVIAGLSAVSVRGELGAPEAWPPVAVRQGLPVDSTITIRSTGSALEFSPSRIAVRHGARVRIRYVNAGTLPHNFVLVHNGDDIDLLGLAALDASETDYVPLEHDDKMIAHSPLAAPGDTVEVLFDVPPPGEYFFVCLYAGHYNMMVGTLRSLR